MKRELTYTDVSRIQSYVENMGVDFYDVQVEIVDHIASAIEEQLILFPERSFQEVFDSTLASFDNLSPLVHEKLQQVTRQYNRYFRKSIFDFFKWPRVVFAIVLLGVIYSMLKAATPVGMVVFKNHIFGWSMGLTIAYCGFVGWRNHVQYHKLCTTHILGWFPLFTQFPQILIVFTNYAEKYQKQHTLLLALIYTLILIFIGAFVESYEKIRKYGRDKYLKMLSI